MPVDAIDRGKYTDPAQSLGEMLRRRAGLGKERDARKQFDPTHTAQPLHRIVERGGSVPGSPGGETSNSGGLASSRKR